MRGAFPEAMTPTDPAAVEEADNSPKDRHVAAVALTTAATAIVTLNIKDFHGQALPQAGIAVLTPGALVSRLLDQSPELPVLAVRHLASRWIDPSRTPAEITDDLAVHPSMLAPMRRLRDLLE